MFVLALNAIRCRRKTVHQTISVAAHPSLPNMTTVRTSKPSCFTINKVLNENNVKQSVSAEKSK